ncbi:MAG: hypothetical protein WCO26_24950 [Deltaproteobacteria bacterium]
MVKAMRVMGYTVKDACRALGISRSGYYAQASRTGVEIVQNQICKKTKRKEVALPWKVC